MKKFTLLTALCAICMTAFAQDEQQLTSFKPLQGDWAMTFGFAGLNVLGLTSAQDPLNNAFVADIRYFWRDNIAFRAGVGVNNQKTEITTANDTSGGTPLTVTVILDKATGYTFGLGAEKHLKTKARRVDPFLGFGAGFTTLGENTVTNTKTTTQRNGDYTETVTETINPGGHAIGLSLSMGFYWYFTQGVAFGGQINLGYAFGGLGGDVVVNTNTTTSIGTAVTTTHSTTTTTNNTDFSGLQTINTGTLQILVKF